MADGERKGRGAILTIFAISLALMAISNFSKPLKMRPDVGFVFLGMKLSAESFNLSFHCLSPMRQS